MVRVAALQHGRIHRRQLEAAGLGRYAIARRIRIGSLTSELPSVFSLIGARSDAIGTFMAAVLYCKGDAVLGSWSAASLWGILDATQQPRCGSETHVLLLGRNAAQPGIKVQRVSALQRQDLRWRDGIPVSSPARTLLDLAATMSELELESALSAAFRKKLVRRNHLVDVIERNPQARGIRCLRSLLEQAGSLRDTRSKYERKLLELLKAAELPLPLTNQVIDGKLVDGVWPELKLAYEFDGWIYHRDKFERDRLRDQQMLTAGHQIFRISGRQIDHKPYALVARIAAIITARRLEASGGPA